MGHNSIIGHTTVKEAFRKAHKERRLHHAWLLYGEKGIGKASLASELAAEVLGEGALEKVLNETHPDFLLVKRRPNEKGELPQDISINELRKVLNFLHQTASLSKWRVVIIDSLDELNTQSANALLKILEEPPGFCLFFLITHSIGSILPTLKSRCLKVSLKPLNGQEIAAYLALNYPTLQAERLKRLLVLSEGNPGFIKLFMEEEGESLYEILSKALNDQMPFLSSSTYEILSQKAYLKRLDLLESLLLKFLRGLIQFGIDSEAGSLKEIREVEEIYKKYLKSKSLEDWVKICERIEEILSEGNALNLDRGHVFLTALTYLS